MSSEITITGAVLDKLDKLPIATEISDIDILPALSDTLRELSIPSCTDIAEGSQLEFYVELRTEYWTLHRLRNSESLNFKYSTSIDGRAIDKSMIPKMIDDIMNDLDDRFKNWYNNTYNRRTSGVWTMPRRQLNRLQ